VALRGSRPSGDSSNLEERKSELRGGGTNGMNFSTVRCGYLPCLKEVGHPKWEHRLSVYPTRSPRSTHSRTNPPQDLSGKLYLEANLLKSSW